jgi:CheY-like chemotaxis protein
MSAKADSCSTPVNILVAEDDCDDVLLLRRAFKRAGISANLFFVSDGQEAIEFLQRAGPNGNRPECPMPALLVVDLNMPGLGGMEVLEWLMTRPELGRVRVVIFSSVIAPHVSEAALKLGAYRCMTKPIDPHGWAPLCLALHACAAPSAG